jgi:uncharacterized membrane protein
MPRNQPPDRKPRSVQPAQPTQITWEAHQQQIWNYPIPPPEIMQEYEQLYPGITQKYWDNFLGQTEHRQHLERISVEADSRRATWGLLIGFIIALFSLGSSVLLILTGHSTEGLVAVIVVIGSLSSIFVYGNMQRIKGRLQQTEIINKHSQK